MKKFLFILLAVPVLFFVACDDDDDTPPNPRLVINLDELLFTNAAGEKELVLTSNLSWTAESNQAWCVVSPLAGTNDATLKVRVETNNDANVSRTAIVTVKAVNADITRKIEVKQEDGVPQLSVNPKVRTFDAYGHTFDVDVTSNVNYQVIMPSDNWVVQSTSTGVKALSTTSVSFEIFENTTKSARETQIIFKHVDSNLADTLRITQESAFDNLLGDAIYNYRNAESQENQEKAITITWDDSTENIVLINGISTNPLRANVAVTGDEYVLTFNFPQDAGEVQVPINGTNQTFDAVYTPLYYNSSDVLTVDPDAERTLTARTKRNNIHIVMDNADYGLAGVYSNNNVWNRLNVSAIPGSFAITKSTSN